MTVAAHPVWERVQRAPADRQSSCTLAVAADPDHDAVFPHLDAERGCLPLLAAHAALAAVALPLRVVQRRHAKEDLTDQSTTLSRAWDVH